MADIQLKHKRDGATVYAMSERGKAWLSEFTFVNVGLVPWCQVTDEAVVEYECAARQAGLEVEIR